jgi:hypothetical protein
MTGRAFIRADLYQAEAGSRFKMRNLSNSTLLGTCVTKYTRAMRYSDCWNCLAREKQLNVHAIPMSAPSLSRSGWRMNLPIVCSRRVGRELPRVGISASGHSSRCYSAGS